MDAPHAIRALLVEDEVLIRMTLRFMLEDLGCEIVGETGFGEEAPELSRKLSPDVVFMDIRLNGKIDGIEAARRIPLQPNSPFSPVGAGVNGSQFGV